MRTYPKRLLTVLLVLAMLVSIIAVPTTATEADSGTTTTAAKIGETPFETLQAAIDAATSGDTIAVLAGTHTISSYKGKSLTFEGESKDAILNVGDNEMAADNLSLTFKNMTLLCGNADYNGLTRATAETYIDCVIEGQIITYAVTANFTDCVFNQTANTYNIRTYGSTTLNFNTCTFNSVGRSILVYNEGYEPAQNQVTNINGCTINASAAAEGKAAVEVDTTFVKTGNKFTVNITNTTSNGFDEGSVSGNTLWNNKLGSRLKVTVDGETVLVPGVARVGDEGYETLEAAIAAANGQTVELLKDVTLTEQVVIDEDVTITAEEAHTITVTIAEGNTQEAFGGLRVENGTLTLGANVTVTNVGSHEAGVSTVAAVGSNAKVVIDGATVKSECQNNAIEAGDNAYVTVVSGHVYATEYTAAYTKGGATIEVKGGTVGHKDYAVFGMAAAKFNAATGGKIIISGGEVYNVVSHEAADSKVTISGGTVNGTLRVKSPAAMEITDGTINCTLDVREGATMTVSGGTFSKDPSSYLATGYCVKESDSKFVVGTHEVNGVANETHHWSECLHCGDKTEEVAHTYTLEDVVEAHLKSAATCTSPAVYYKSCSGCGYPSSNDADTFTYGTALVHELTPVAAKAATCTENGVNAHYTCSGCGKLFNDPDGKSEITKQQATVLAKGHKAVMGVEGKLPTCTTPGNIEYVECSCGALFTDAECKNEITLADTVVAATGHKLTKVAAKAATCTTAGNTEYYSCANCNALFADAEGKTATTAEKVVVAATGHKLTKVEAVAPTYTAGGNIEHYACACGALFADAEGKTATTAEAVKLAQLIEIKESTAEVSSDAVDTAIKEAETIGSITIDLVEVAEEEAAKPESGSGSTTPDSGSDTTTKPAPVVSSAALPVKSLEKVAEISEEATLTVNMTEVTVTIDAKAMAAVAEQSAAETVTLKVEKVEAETLTEEQQAVIEDKEVAVVVTATLISNNTAISDFKGGSVTIAIPFALPEGTEGSDFQVYYVADDGTMTAHDTEYKNGCLVFSTTHFSDYVVVNTAAPADPTVPNTGDTADLMLYTTALMIALTGLAVLFIGKKKFSF